jgi:recombination protein RecA
MAVRAEVKRDEWIEFGTGNSKRRIGQTIRVRTIKNKTAPPQQVAYMDFYFDGGGDVLAGDYDFAKETVALAIRNGVVERRGGWIYYGERKWQGAEALLRSIREELDLREDLESGVIDTLKSIISEDTALPVEV